ncbi:glycosyltransferase [Agromyces sp. MMS24-JH15]|uniref:glycosyltransferase n=1 Tax=Agromyces sp. MMS24-JH15 TaxID=3243765 RepID=UPI00374830B0
MTESTAPSLAIVTVGYRSAGPLAGMLASIPAATSRPVMIVVADNLPGADDTPGVVGAIGGDYVAMTQNLGYGGAVNAAVTRLPGVVEWILVTNPDVTFHPEAIDRLREVGEADPHVGAVGPLVRNADGTPYPSARAIPGLGVGVGHAVLAPVWPGNPWTRRYHAATAVDAERDAGWLSGSCVLVRRSAFEEVGGFDPDFFMYFEDVDLGVRLARAGWRNRFTPVAEVTHTGGHSTEGESDAMVQAHHRSAERFLAKKYPGPLWWPVRASLAIGLRVRAGLSRRRRR